MTRARWSKWLDFLETGFWFVPIAMLVFSGGLALLLLYVDERFDPGVKSIFSWAYSGGPEGARSLLSTIAGSMITAASVTFSLAAVALSIASQQYGSRVLRNFMRDKITQILLGTFVSTFLYCVLVVRDIRGTEVSGGFVPAISVTVAIALSLVSLVLLVYFIHHISSAIQASRIVLVIAEDMERAIPRLYPSEAGEPAAEAIDLKTAYGDRRVAIQVVKSGYLQSISLDELLQIATDLEVVIEAALKPGDHAVRGEDAAGVWGTAGLSEKDAQRIQNAFIFGGQRTPLQDIRYQFQQLTDVIVRALSPGINDPFTAMNGVDELTTGVALLARRSRVSESRQDQQGHLRLVAPVPDLAGILDETVGHIAIYAAGDRFVMRGLRRLLDVVEGDLKGERETRALTRLRGELNRLEGLKGVPGSN